MFFSRRSGSKHFVREDPDIYDVSVGDLTIDGDWHDLDLSGIIPKNTKMVLLRVRAKEGTGLKSFFFREKGIRNEPNTSVGITMGANIFYYGSHHVAPNSEGNIQYLIFPSTWTTFSILVCDRIV